MTPQVQLDRRDRVVEAEPTPAPIPAVPAPPREMTEGDRQGLAMGWVSIGLGLFLLIGGLALWGAVALHAAFAGWLIGMTLLGLAIVAVVLFAITYTVVRTRR